MATYLLLFVGEPAQPAANDAETQAYSTKWAQYLGGLAEQGALQSAHPLEAAGKVVTKDAVRDVELRPLDIGGYLVVRADSESDAVAIAAGAPHVALGGSTIVRPCIELPVTPG